MSDAIVTSQHYERLTLHLQQDGSEMQLTLPAGTLDYLGDNEHGTHTLVISWDNETGGQLVFTNKVKEEAKFYYLHITMKAIGVVRYDERLTREEYLILQGYPGKTVDYSGRKSTILTTRLEEKDLSPESITFLTRMQEIGVIQGWTVEETEDSKY